ncbi:MAG: hypothetical protein GXP42_11355 [Chloroflexi bacterium]|nr:hypothetical protein [Chloroflexota bacterium]
MWILISLFFIVLVGVVVLWPYLRQEPELEKTVEADPRLTALYSERDRLYQAIRDAKFDLETGKLSQEDFQNQSAQLKHRAAAVLRAIDELEEQLFPPELDAALEAEIRRARMGVNGGQSHAAVEESPRVRTPAGHGETRDRFCGRCGSALQAGDRFCGACGHAVGA